MSKMLFERSGMRGKLGFIDRAHAVGSGVKVRREQIASEGDAKAVRCGLKQCHLPMPVSTCSDPPTQGPTLDYFGKAERCAAAVCLNIHALATWGRGRYPACYLLRAGKPTSLSALNKKRGAQTAALILVEICSCACAPRSTSMPCHSR